MLVAAAVCPAPPMLVPEVAAGAAPELDSLREACAEAVEGLAASGAERLVVVGPVEEDGSGMHDQGAVGSFHAFGVDLEVTLGPPMETAPARPLPPALAIGAWLLRESGWSAGPCQGLGVGEPFDPSECVRVGHDLAAAKERLALLVMGDGSACRTVKAPGYFDERAAAFDGTVAAALATADTAALIGLDARLASELMALGRAPWQVLAGAAEGAGLKGRLLREEAPYGVGYFVALWS
ncbi:class III extradiol dioxygenase subunit B-like domain-containing protein [Wenjunlia tyrosinilytica]|uniref:Extradiol ring-cleavage dioxygenase class III enzyme subunit B domain-containing protein n=1 Tax=Wenjunlia tyrosinilytica TaxID=1544741 RepID=A0A917ZRR8_9ACTN|nr:class III extradiol dioxygenase subunit B-like domain-containing protein [Wenjunlia tyrosinilytica]GGO91493.1 hypothetical protein GCM10012280_39510 [Wenjunlia tyrosinilytica]